MACLLGGKQEDSFTRLALEKDSRCKTKVVTQVATLCCLLTSTIFPFRTNYRSSLGILFVVFGSDNLKNLLKAAVCWQGKPLHHSLLRKQDGHPPAQISLFFNNHAFIVKQGPGVIGKDCLRSDFPFRCEIIYLAGDVDIQGRHLSSPRRIYA